MKTYSQEVVRIQGKGKVEDGMKKLGIDGKKVDIKQPTEKVLESRKSTGQKPADSKSK